MRLEDFLLSDTAQQILKRASNIGGTSIAIFDYTDQLEGANCTGCGSSAEACAYVNALSWGAQACKKSRQKAANGSLKRRKPVPFICHMGFSGVAITTISHDDTSTAIILGPFCPSEAPNSLTLDALEGLSVLENKEVESLPFTLNDIPNTSAQSLPEVAEWLCETLTYSFESAQQLIHSDTPENNVSIRNSSSKTLAPEKQTPFDSGVIVAALVGGDTKQARILVHSQIIGTVSRRKTILSVQRARCVAIVASVLEWAEHADADTSPCWEKFTAFQKSIQESTDDGNLTTAAMKVLSPIHRQKKFPTKPSSKNRYDFAPLNKLIRSSFKDGITLTSIAKTLGENPTTITKRLQRTFGLSYSDYVGRMKIDHAKKLLRTTKLTAGDIGKRVGVNDSTNFSKLFRKHERITPTKFRAQYGKKR